MPWTAIKNRLKKKKQLIMISQLHVLTKSSKCVAQANSFLQFKNKKV